MALGSTQPLVKMSTRNIPGGKGSWCVRLTTSPPSCAKSGSLNLLESFGPRRACYSTPLPYLYMGILHSNWIPMFKTCSPIYSHTLRLYSHGSEFCELFCILNCCYREITCNSTQSVTRSVGRASGPPVCVYEL